MITELKAGATYRLINKGGWFVNHSKNKVLFEKWFTGESVTLEDIDEDGDGLCGNDVVIYIGVEDQFFEEVVEKMVTQDTASPKSIFIRGEEWLVVAEHPTQKGTIICVRVKDNCVDCFDSIFVEEKLNPKSWQENIETHLGFEYSHTCKSFYISKRTLSEEGLINMAKCIIELSGGV